MEGWTTPATLPGYLYLAVDGRYCTPTGSFEIQDIAFGRSAYLERVHLTLDQSCYFSGGAARGEILFQAEPPPPTLTLTSTVGSVTTSRTTGIATANVTVTCNKYIQFDLNLNLRQRLSKTTVADGVG